MDLSKATPQDIFEYKQQWKKQAHVVEVHSDLHIECKDWCRKNCERWEWSMDTYTSVYGHTFFFQYAEDAESFSENFERWVL